MRFIIWSAEFNGPKFEMVEGASLREALADAGMRRTWFESGNEPTIIQSSDGETVPGCWDLGDDAAFDADVPEAMDELGRSIVKYILDAVKDGLMPIELR